MQGDNEVESPCKFVQGDNEVESPCNRSKIDPFENLSVQTEGGSCKGRSPCKFENRSVQTEGGSCKGRSPCKFVQGANEVESPCKFENLSVPRDFLLRRPLAEPCHPFDY